MPKKKTLAIKKGNIEQLFEKSQYHEIISHFEQYEENPILEPALSFIYAASLFKVGEYARAGRILDLVSPSLDSESSFLSLHAATSRRLGNLSQADALFKKAIALDPEDLAIQNNYANLLIDCNDLEKAERTLIDILQKVPSYPDAKSNLERLYYLKTANSQDSGQNGIMSSIPSSRELDIKKILAQDPLMMAFCEDEVTENSISFGMPLLNNPQAMPDSSIDSEKHLGYEQLKLAKIAVRENNPTFALNLCSQAYNTIGINADIYLTAADAYLSLQQFSEAELCIHQALQLCTPTVIQYINLTSLACIRSDIKIARYYLQRATALDPSCNHLSRLHDMIESKNQEINHKKFFNFNKTGWKTS